LAQAYAEWHIAAYRLNIVESVDATAPACRRTLGKDDLAWSAAFTSTKGPVR
jgi:hypothetical protein